MTRRRDRTLVITDQRQLIARLLDAPRPFGTSIYRDGAYLVACVRETTAGGKRKAWTRYIATAGKTAAEAEHEAQVALEELLAQRYGERLLLFAWRHLAAVHGKPVDADLETMLSGSSGCSDHRIGPLEARVSLLVVEAYGYGGDRCHCCEGPALPERYYCARCGYDLGGKVERKRPPLDEPERRRRRPSDAR